MSTLCSAVVSTVLFAGFVAAATPALACSFEPWPPQFQLDRAKVPSTIGGALYRDCKDQGNPDRELGLTIRAEGSDDEISHRLVHLRQELYEVIFEEPLKSDTIYLVESADCGFGELTYWSWSFQTTESAEEPKELGVWVPSDRRQGAVKVPDDGACSRAVDAAYIELNFEPGADAETWGKALAFETYVDGQLWEPQETVATAVPPGTSRLGYGKEQVFAVCDNPISPHNPAWSRSLDQGIHRVEIRAYLPGTDLFWTSESYSFVLRCDETGAQAESGGDADDQAEPDADEKGVADEGTGCAQTPGIPGFIWITVAIELLVLRRRQR